MVPLVTVPVMFWAAALTVAAKASITTMIVILSGAPARVERAISARVPTSLH